MYELATLLVINIVKDYSLTQNWYADDGNEVGKLKSLQTAVDNIIKQKKFFCYHVKALKCQLIVENEKYNEAKKVYKNTETEMKRGVRVLVFAIGSETEYNTSWKLS